MGYWERVRLVKDMAHPKEDSDLIELIRYAILL